MNARLKMIFLLVAALTTAGAFTSGQLALAGGGGSQKGTHNIGFTDEFFLEDCTFATTGSNRYFVLEPNYQQVFRGEEKDGTEVELIITVLDETEVVDGVETRVMEERESQDGVLVEVSRNFLAICEQTNSVIYFGEDVDFYDEQGNIVSHEGQWRAGEGDNEAGMFMPGTVLLGAKYFQEIAPDIAMDQALIVSVGEEVETPAGEFEDVLKVEETTPLEPGVREYKFHAPGIGLIQDEDLKLVKYVLPKADMNGKGDVEKLRMERRQEIVAKESGEQIHQRHMEAAPASPGKYSPGLNYTLEVTGTATGVQGESRSVSLTMDVSVWKSNGAVLILDVVGGTVRIGDETHDIELGYALYSIQHNIFRSSSLVTADNGDVFVLKLRGSAEMATEGIELPTTSEGDPVELMFDENNMDKNSLDGWKLTLNGTLEA